MTRSGMYEGYWRDIDKDVMKYVLHMEMVGPVKNITIIRERDSLILVKMADDGTVSYSVIWMIPGKDNWNGVEGISAPEEAFKSLDEILADTPLAQISPEGIQAMLYIIQHTELTPDEQRMLNESLKEMKIDSEYVMIELLAMLSRSGDEVPFLSKGTMLTLLKRVSAELAQDDPNSQSTNIDAIQASSAILAAESLYSKDASDHIDESHIERTVRYIRMSMEEGIASNKMFQHEIDFIIANVVAREFNNVDYADIVHMIKLLEEERGKYHSLVDYYPPVALSGAYPHRVSYMQSYHFEDNHVLSDVYAVATKGTPQNIEALLSQIALEYHWQTMRMRVQKALP
ncbi:hypothetical protein A3F32_00755 [Candidatus Roizmanbacteria bacterium RIFCSPHIGHO2_12_FULL_42_10]|nr:MAG: hypothetical protein A3F32_00755 [Candidatus Roizmanbacteria bacterium RIFCSPHIGHO2_12_FULL_42_10]